MKTRELFSLLSLSAGLLVAQVKYTTSVTANPTPPQLAPGRPDGVYALSNLETINVYNGHLSASVPLLTIGGRGTAGYTMRVRITPTPWRGENEVSMQPNELYGMHAYTSSISPDWEYPEYPWAGAGFGAGSLFVRYAGEQPTTTCRGNSLMFLRTMTSLVWVSADGTETTLYNAAKPGVIIDRCLSGPGEGAPDRTRSGHWRASDGSGLVFLPDPNYFIADRTEPADLENLGDYGFPSGTLITRDGTRYRILDSKVLSIQDRNGNRVEFCYTSLPSAEQSGSYDTVACKGNSNFDSLRVKHIKDPLGRVTTITYGDSASDSLGVDSWVHTITYPAVGGTKQIKVLYRKAGIRLRQGLSAPTPLFPDVFSEMARGTSGVSEIRLPNDKRYGFFYNAYGEIARLELPTGAVYEYDHEAGLVGTPYVSGQINDGYTSATLHLGPIPRRQVLVYRRLVKRRAYISSVDHGTGCDWTPAASDSNPCETETTYSRPEKYVTTNAGVFAVEFNNGGAENYFSVTTKVKRGVETVERHHYHGCGSYLMVTCSPVWQMLTESTFSGNPTSASEIPVRLKMSSLIDGKEFRTEILAGTVVKRSTENTFTYKDWTNNGIAPPSIDGNNIGFVNVTRTDEAIKDTGAGKTTRVDFDYDSLNNRKLVTEFDFDGVAKREVETSYKGGTYLSTDLNILGLPDIETVYTGSGSGRTKAAETKFTYDTSELTLPAGLCTPDGQHTAPTANRGNLTKVERWRDLPTSTYLANKFAYDTAGNRVLVSDGRSAYSLPLRSRFSSDRDQDSPDCDQDSSLRLRSGFSSDGDQKSGQEENRDRNERIMIAIRERH